MATLAVNDLALVGINHFNAKVAVREKLSIPHDEASHLLTTLHERELAHESLVLSTCNRTELYCLSSQPEMIMAQILGRTGRHLEELQELFYIKRGRQVIQHAFAVASGLDSMILGEPEILGQMKKAFAAARTGNFAGLALGQLFEKAFRVAKQVRTETAISRESVSAPAICALLAQRIFGKLDSCGVLCIGAGIIVETALQHFTTHQVSRLTVANRTLRRARDLASHFNAQVVPYEEVNQLLHEHDIIITATSSVLPVIGKGALERALRLRRRKPIAIFDLAVPRDVEAEAAELEDLFLHTIDDIGTLVGTNLAKRQGAVDEARCHIDTATEELVEWFERRDAVGIIKNLRNRLDILRDQEIEHSLAALRKGTKPEEALRELAHRLTNQLANDPLQSLRDQHANRDLLDELSNWYANDRKDNTKNIPEA